MIRNFIAGLLTISTIFFISCNKEIKENTNLTITGKVDGLKQGKVYLYQVQDTSFVIIDSVVVQGKEANFVFNHYIDSPEMLFLTLDRGHSQSVDNQISFFAEPGQMTVETTLKNFYKDAKITGSKNDELYKNYLKSRSIITDRQNELLVAIFEAQKANNSSKIDSLDIVSKRLNARLYLNALNFAMINKDADIAPYIALTELYDRNIKYLDTIYNSLSPEIMKHKYAKSLGEFIQQRKQEENN